MVQSIEKDVIEMVKVLSLNVPFVHMTWAPYSHLVSIGQQQEGFQNWALSTLVNIVGVYGDKGSTPFLRYVNSPDPSSTYAYGNVWDACPYVEKLTIDRSFIRSMGQDISDFVIKNINANNYMYLYLLRDLNTRFAHQTLIYGYDLERKVFLVADHFEGEGGRYSTKLISMENMPLHYNIQQDDILEYELDVYKYVYLIKSQPYDFELNLKSLKRSFLDYLNSTPTVLNINAAAEGKQKKYNDTYYYGIDFYTPLMGYIHREIANENNESCDHRPLAFFKESKKITCLLVEYLFENSFVTDKSLIEASDEIFQISAILLGLYLKYSVSKDAKILDKIVSRLTELREMDKKFIFHLIKDLEALD